MLGSCLVSLAFGLGLGLRFKAFVLMLANAALMAGAVGILALTEVRFDAVLAALPLCGISLQVGYVLSALWVNGQRRPIRLAPRKG